MRTIIRFLITFKTLFLFLFLEIVSLLLVVNYNQFQKTVFLNSSNVVVGSIYNISNSIYEYFGLKSVNLKLADENAQLRDKLYMIDNELAELKRDTTFKQRNDQSEEKNYSFIPAKVINASVNKYRNFITLNKGALDGVKTEMGVINEDGVIGIVSSTSDHFSVVIPILNPSSRISAKINNKSQTGSLLWDGKKTNKAILEEIPLYIQIALGDTVVTSGYSSIFPEGITIGTVNKFNKANDNFYNIEVDLSADFCNLSFVDVVDYKYFDEQKELEKGARND